MVGTFARDVILRLRPATTLIWVTHGGNPVVDHSGTAIHFSCPAKKTVRGSDVPDWEHVTILEIPGCSMQPAGTGLSQDGRVLGLSDGMTCYCPYDADVREGDRIQFEGLVYVIDGLPRKWRSPTGNRSNMQLNLKRWSG